MTRGFIQRIARRLKMMRSEAPSLPPAFLQQVTLLDGIDSPVIFDVGAHTGCTTNLYLQHFPKARVFAFEPTFESRVELELFAARHPSVKVIAAAVSNRTGISNLYQNSFSATNSLSPTDNRATNFWNDELLTPTAVTEVAILTIDDFSKESGLNRIDILKLDIQGSELAALNGARRLLTAKAIGLVYMELLLVPTYQSQGNLTDICCLLKECDYEFHSAFAPVLRQGRINQVDAIFVPRVEPRNTIA